MSKHTTDDTTRPVAAPASAGRSTQMRVLISDQVAPVVRTAYLRAAPAVRTAYLRAVPVVVDARGRVQDTVQVRVVPAVREAGDRLGPVVTTATLGAGATARATGAKLNAHGRPVAAEAARRGRNTLDALLGSDLTPAPAPTPVRSRGLRLRRRVRWLAAAGAVGGAAYGAWQLRTRRVDTPGPDIASPVPDPAAVAVEVEVAPTVVDLPEAVADPAVIPVVDTVEPAAHDLDRQPGAVHGDPDSTTIIS